MASRTIAKLTHSPASGLTSTLRISLGARTGLSVKAISRLEHLHNQSEGTFTQSTLTMSMVMAGAYHWKNLQVHSRLQLTTHALLSGLNGTISGADCRSGRLTDPAKYQRILVGLHCLHSLYHQHRPRFSTSARVFDTQRCYTLNDLLIPR